MTRHKVCCATGRLSPSTWGRSLTLSTGTYGCLACQILYISCYIVSTIYYMHLVYFFYLAFIPAASCNRARAVVLLPVQTSWASFDAVQNCPQLNWTHNTHTRTYAHALLMPSDVNNYRLRSCGSQSASEGKLSWAEIDARHCWHGTSMT